jgi:hypothetical protein
VQRCTDCADDMHNTRTPRLEQSVARLSSSRVGIARTDAVRTVAGDKPRCFPLRDRGRATNVQWFGACPRARRERDLQEIALRRDRRKIERPAHFQARNPGACRGGRRPANFRAHAERRRRLRSGLECHERLAVSLELTDAHVSPRHGPRPAPAGAALGARGTRGVLGVPQRSNGAGKRGTESRRAGQRRSPTCNAGCERRFRNTRSLRPPHTRPLLAKTPRFR